MAIIGNIAVLDSSRVLIETVAKVPRVAAEATRNTPSVHEAVIHLIDVPVLARIHPARLIQASNCHPTLINVHDFHQAASIARAWDADCDVVSTSWVRTAGASTRQQVNLTGA